ncbi:MAG: hypothetical protein ACI8VT_001159 [Saprospiraceae bacterium]|jgi:hypothetical protein
MIFENPDTAVETINALNNQGYSHSFSIENGEMRCLENGKTYNSDEIKIDEQFRFEGMSNPADSSILFAVSCEDSVKGVVISAYGLYANIDLLKFMGSLKMK